jgi:hypothetical protein
MVLGSTAQLQVAFSTEAGTPTPCQPVASGGYLQADNQMIRVEIVSVSADGVPTIAWGPDDATFLFRVVASPPGAETITLTLASPPVDSNHFPQAGQTVELLASAVALAPATAENPASYVASPTGYVTTLAGPYASDPQQVVLNTPTTQPLPAAYLDTEVTPQLFLRVWQGSGPITPGTAFALNDSATGYDTGATVTLSPTTGFHVGDFWRFALRPIQPTQIYPARYLDGPQPPDGPLTWAGPLATVSWAGTTPTVTSCVPSFENLVELSEDSDGCCTVVVSPGDVDDGAGLPALLAQFANQDPVTICLTPGTYTLAAPLEIGAANSGLTLRACQGGVVLTGPSTPPATFQAGLVTVRQAAGVSFEGIGFEPVATAFAAPTASVSALGTADDTLVEAYTGNVEVAIGVTVVGASDLSVTDCSFTYPASTGSTFGVGVLATGAVEGCTVTGTTFTSSPAPTSLPYNEISLGFSADPPYQATFGVLLLPSTTPATYTVEGQTAGAALQVGDVARPSEVQGLARTEDLAAGIGTEVGTGIGTEVGTSVGTGVGTSVGTGVGTSVGTGVGTFAGATAIGGITAAGGTTTPPPPPSLPIATSLDDAVIESCTFDGVTVASMMIGHVGTVRFDRNVVRQCYGGFWVFTSDSTSFATELSQLAPSSTDATDTPSTSAYLDPLIKLAYAMGLLLPLVPTVRSVIGEAGGLKVEGLASGVTLRDEDALLTRQAEVGTKDLAVSTGTEIAAGLGETVSTEEGTLIGSTGLLPGLGYAPSAPEPPATTEVGTDVLLRLTCVDNQIDAVLADTYSGAGLVVADQSTVAGSAIVTGNRIRSRFYRGQTVLVEQVAEAAINDNLIANEAVPPTVINTDLTYVPPADPCYSLVVSVPVLLAQAAVVVTGNVLVGSVDLPARTVPGLTTDAAGDDSTLVALLSSWAFLNTVIAPYAAPTTPSGI